MGNLWGRAFSLRDSIPRLPHSFSNYMAQKSIRIVLPSDLYNKLKDACQDHGDISKLVRKLLINYLKALEG